MLRGNGRGKLAPVPPGESGLVVPGDAKALAVIDIDQDGWPDFLVTRNNSTTLAFQNKGVAERKSVRIRLSGPAGNPTGVGAIISVELANGSRQACEVLAGSGYYSQSTAACFFGYNESNPPVRARVRWPLGTSSEHDVPRGSSDARTLLHRRANRQEIHRNHGDRRGCPFRPSLFSFCRYAYQGVRAGKQHLDGPGGRDFGGGICTPLRKARGNDV